MPDSKTSGEVSAWSLRQRQFYCQPFTYLPRQPGWWYLPARWYPSRTMKLVLTYEMWAEVMYGTSRVAHKMSCTPHPLSFLLWQIWSHMETAASQDGRNHCPNLWLTAWRRGCELENPHWPLGGWEITNLFCWAAEIWQLFATASMIHLIPWKLVPCNGLLL